MTTRWVAASMVALVIVVLGMGCEEWMVGAPCKPETDDEKYIPQDKQTYAIETRSVQCQTSICVTKTDGRRSPQVKYSFCSCRCKDKDEHGWERNSDKYNDLCECPPGTECSPDVISNNIEQVPDKLKGSYCIPGCIVRGCDSGEVCKPSNDSEEPWKWKCKVK
jgi:hypothetical protein